MPTPRSRIRLKPVTTAAVSQWWLSDGLMPADVVAAYQPLGMGSLESSLVNLAAPGTAQLVVGGALSHSAELGWIFDGAASFLVSDIVPASGYSLFVRFGGAVNTTGDSVVCGSTVSGASRRFYIEPSINNRVLYGSGGYQFVAPGLLNGVLGIAGQQGYRNGLADGTPLNAWDGGVALPLYIGKLNGDAGAFWAGHVAALVVYRVTLNAAQVAALSAVMAAL